MTADNGQAAATSAALSKLAPLLWHYLRPQGLRVLMLGLCLAGGVGLQLVAPQMTSRFIDLVSSAARAAPMGQLSAAGRPVHRRDDRHPADAAGRRLLQRLVGWSAANALRDDLAPPLPGARHELPQPPHRPAS